MIRLTFGSLKDVDPHLRKIVKIFNTIGLVAIVVLLVLVISTWGTPTVRLKNNVFNVEVMRTDEQRQRGLSGREKLDIEAAMLFEFEMPDKHCFWMKDMKFNIDILWFNDQNRLIHQERNAPLASYPNSFCPPAPAKYVLEVQAGTADRLNLQNGETIYFSNL